MKWEQFAVFVVVVFAVSLFVSWVNPTLVSFFGGWGIIGSALLFLIPMFLLWWALKRFVFKRA